MTPVTYEPGRLTLAPEAFLILAALDAGTAVDELASATEVTAAATHLDALRAAGAVLGDRVAADLRPLTVPVTEAVCELQLDVDDRRVLGWIAADDAVLLLPTDDGRVEVIAAPTTSFPRVVADLTGLGPRRAPARQLAAELGPEDLETLLRTPPEDLRPQAGDLTAEVTEALAALVEEFRSRWRIEVSWGSSTGERRALEVLDAPAGLWWVDRHLDHVLVATTTPTEVYAAISGLLPDADELPDDVT